MVCPGPKHYNYLQVGLSQAAITSYVQYNYYPDKQIVVSQGIFLTFENVDSNETLPQTAS